MTEKLRNKAICEGQAAIIRKHGETSQAYAIVREMIAELNTANVSQFSAIVAKHAAR